MVQVTREEAASNLGRLLEQVGQGKEFVIVKDGSPLARLSPVAPRQPGSAVGIVTYVAEDFDAPQEDSSTPSDAPNSRHPPGQRQSKGHPIGVALVVSGSS